MQLIAACHLSLSFCTKHSKLLTRQWITPHINKQSDKLMCYIFSNVLLFFSSNYLEILANFLTIYKLSDLFFKFLTFYKLSKFFKPVDTTIFARQSHPTSGLVGLLQTKTIVDVKKFYKILH